MINAKTQAFIAEHGGWTAMAIKLADGSYTTEPRPDHRLRRLVQVAQDVIKKPISECRVLDLACLEGHYAIEFALHGAQATGIEGREVSVAKCDYARNDLKLDRLSFCRDDVRALTREKYGTFDIVICSGILYHLKADDAWRFVHAMSDVCTGVLLIDTFVSLYGREGVTLPDGSQARGHYYFEHNEGDGPAAKQAKLWASLDNANSFWFTEQTLVNLLTGAGFTSVMDILTPTMPGNPRDRKTYLAIKGTPIVIASSDATLAEPLHPIPEGENPQKDASQVPRGTLFKIAKAILPPSVKEAIKPALRAAKILPPDTTPAFQKKKR